MLVLAGVNRVVSFDLHCGQIQGFFPATVPCDNIPAAQIAVDYFADMVASKASTNVSVAVVSPDAGGTVRAKNFMHLMSAKTSSTINFAMINKERKVAGVIDTMTLVGDVKGQICIIVDDMIDTAGTLAHAANNLIHQEGALEVYAFATHGVFSGDAMNKIDESVLKEVVVCDTIPPPAHLSPKIKYLSVNTLLSSVISCIINCESVSDVLT